MPLEAKDRDRVLLTFPIFSNRYFYTITKSHGNHYSQGVTASDRAHR